jgi:hypothetical protein
MAEETKEIEKGEVDKDELSSEALVITMDLAKAIAKHRKRSKNKPLTKEWLIKLEKWKN